MFRASPDPDLDLDLATAKKGGLIHGASRTVTFPFRAMAAVVVGVVGLLIGLLRILTFPFRLAFGLIRRVVGLAADIVFALWRVVMWVVGLVLGVFTLIFAVLNATIGNAVRLVFKIAFGTLRLVLKIVTLGRFGRSAAGAAAGAAVASNAIGTDT